MAEVRTLIALLIGLCLIGAWTAQTMFVTGRTMAEHLTWSLYLILAPMMLLGLVWAGWTWTAMLCVIYGTIGLALDLATVISIIGGNSAGDALLPLSGVSGILNFLLIVFGGRASVKALQGPPPPESRPPNPPSPSSSAAI